MASLTALVLGATTFALAPSDVATAQQQQDAQQQQQQQQDEGATAARVAGEDRYATAADLATFHHDRAPEALLATGSDFPDALAAAALAGLRDAPVLLTRPDDLPTVTAEAMQDLAVERVTILGGPTAVSPAVEAELAQNGYDTTRVRGTDRYGTAAAIARTVQRARDNGANFPGDRRAAFLASGQDFPDALAAAPLSAASPSPVPMLLTAEEFLPRATRDVLVDLDVETVFVVGGPTAVDPTVEQELEDLGIAVDRISGDDRTATAVAVADFGRAYLGFDLDHVVLARGDDFPDALAAGPFAGDHATPVLLTPNPNELGPHTEHELVSTCDTVDVVRAVGGHGAIAPSTLRQAVDAADACSDTNPPEQGQTYVVAPMERLTRAPGEGARFRVMGEDDSRTVQGPVDVTFVPCEESDVTGGDEDRFDDSDGDAHADRIGDSDAGTVEITAVNGRAQPDGTAYVASVSPDADGEVSFTLTGHDRDCATALVLSDEDDDRGLDLFRREPAEPYGVGQVTWRS